MERMSDEQLAWLVRWSIDAYLDATDASELLDALTAERAAMKRLVEAAERGCDKCEYEDGYIELCREEAGCGFADLRAVLDEVGE